MEIKKSTTHFSYKIEQKPEGGFIARSTDPGVEPIEGATQEEVIQKIQARAMTPFGEKLAGGFKFGGLNVNVTRKVNVTTWTKGTSAKGSDAAEQRLLHQVASDPEAQKMFQDAGFVSPVERSSDSSGTALRVLAALIAIAALVYFFLHR